jgi:hypothetical protein
MIVPIYISAVNVRCYNVRGYEIFYKRYTVPNVQLHKAAPKLQGRYIATCGGV